MDQVEIRASFAGEQALQEALHKLQALRAIGVSSRAEDGRLTATVGADVADRALRLIEQIGGAPERFGGEAGPADMPESSLE